MSRYQNIFDPCTLSEQIEVTSIDEDENEIHVTWNDGHRSTYSINWLLNKLSKKSTRYKDKKLWDVNRIESENFSDVSYEDFMNEAGGGLTEFLKNLYTFGLAFVNDVPLTKEGLITLANRISFIRETELGKDDLVVSTTNKIYDDIVYTNQPLGLHTDSAFSTEPFGYIMFNLIEHTGEGGLGCYVDGYYIAELIRKIDPDAFNILSRVLVTQEFKDKGVHYKGSYPVFNILNDEIKMIRYQTTDRLFIQHLSLEETESFYAALKLFHSHIYNNDNVYWIKYKPGRLIVFDNFRLLHGRSEFTGTRTLRSLILPREEVDSLTRVLTNLG